jgi:ATP-binding cassette subfamily G (WHITE) protein 2 (SNQ2)
MGSLLIFTNFDSPVTCTSDELAIFNPKPNETCAQYLAEFMMNLLNPDATSSCQVCQYRSSNDYLATVNLGEYEYGWRDTGIVAIFVFSSYAMVYLLMKLRTKATKNAE